MIEIKQDYTQDKVTINTSRYEELLDLETRVQVLEEMINKKMVFGLEGAANILGLVIEEGK